MKAKIWITTNFEKILQKSICMLFSISQNKIRILMLELPVLFQSKMLMTWANQPAALSTNRKQAVFRCTRRPWGFAGLIKAVLFFLQWGEMLMKVIFRPPSTRFSSVHCSEGYNWPSFLTEHHSSITILRLHVKQDFIWLHCYNMQFENGVGSSSSNATSNISVSLNRVAASQDDLAAELKSRPVSLVVLESLFLLIINGVAFFGNALVCLAFYRNCRLRIIPNYYIISLALTDLLTSVFSLPFSVGSLIAGRWPFGDWTCRLQGYCVFAFSIASLHTMAQTACNRYIRVVHFHLYHNLYTSKMTITTVLLTWAWALICSALPFILGISTFVFHPGTVICYSSPSFTPASIVLFTTTLTINIPAPMAIVIILYRKVFKAIRQQRFRVSTERRLGTNAEEIRLAQLLFAVSLGFCLCWGPVMAVECIRFIGAWAVSRQVYLISTFFGATSSAINVFIYGVMNRAFRVEFVKILCCKKHWPSNIRMEWCNVSYWRHGVLIVSA